MFDYLQQFNNLPKSLRDQVSSSSTMATIAELEKKYQVELAMVVMKVMVKNINFKNLPGYFISEFNLSQIQAEALTKDLIAKVFFSMADYFGLDKEIRMLDLEADIDLIISEAGLILPSSDLVFRLKNILSTYLKGVRSKLAARDALTKTVALGGLSLSSLEADRLFKICEQKTFKSLDIKASIPKVLNPQSRLDKIIASADAGTGAEYNLKQALASGQVKKIDSTSFKINKPFSQKLDTSHELSAPEEELNLPLAPVKIAQEIIKPVQIQAPVKGPSQAPQVLQASQAPQAPIQTSKPTQVPKPVQIPKPVTPLKPVQMPAPPPIVRQPIASARPVATPNKPIMHDIKPMPKIMGPLEELQFLDLLNFRRLGKTPSESTVKIFSKIKLLEEDGYDKMISGVYAWRQSPVNRLYLKMVQEAISRGVTVREVALAGEKESDNYLKIEEIEAIIALNSKLIF